jgi:hypothetical protein
MLIKLSGHLTLLKLQPECPAAAYLDMPESNCAAIV